MPNPEFERLLSQAQERFDAMMPAHKLEHREAQRRSWVVGETMLEHPEMSREQAEEIYEKVILGIGL